MEETDNDKASHEREGVPAEIAMVSWPGQGFPPEVLAPCMADLKRQIALRQAMP